MDSEEFAVKLNKIKYEAMKGFEEKCKSATHLVDGKETLLTDTLEKEIEKIIEESMKKHNDVIDKNGLKVTYDGGNEIWRGLYRIGKRYSILTKHKGMKGFFKEMNENGNLLSVSEYDDEWRKNGKCFEYEGGRLIRECEYKKGVMTRVLREWKEVMIEYDVNGMRVYEGGFKGVMMKGFVREGEGTELIMSEI